MIDEKKLIEELKQSGMIVDNEYGNAMVDMINDQPKIGEWILCSKLMPEWGTKKYLVCLKNGGIFMAVYTYGKEFKEISSLGMRDFAEDNPVIAWQPLPDSYEETI